MRRRAAPRAAHRMGKLEAERKCEIAAQVQQPQLLRADVEVMRLLAQLRRGLAAQSAR